MCPFPPGTSKSKNEPLPPAALERGKVRAAVVEAVEGVVVAVEPQGRMSVV